jgi:UDP-N-acetylmuramate--alanine ligase
VTNVENDHIDSDAELPRLIEAFERFVASVPPHGLVLVGSDDARAAALAAGTRAARTRTFGFGRADVRALDVRYADFGSRSTIASTACRSARSRSQRSRRDQRARRAARAAIGARTRRPLRDDRARARGLSRRAPPLRDLSRARRA